MHPLPLMVTGRLILREFQSSDVLPVQEIYSSAAVAEFSNFAPFTDVEQAEQFVEGNILNQASPDGQSYRWAIAPAGAPETYMGSCGYQAACPDYRSLEIVYDLHPEYWGMGYASEAVFAMLKSLFSPGFIFPVNRVTAATSLDGRRSIRLLNRLGFSEEGILRQYGYWKDNYHDVRLFSLLRKDWENPKYPAR